MSDITSFENFIIKCCELDEWDLRIFLRETLTNLGFKIQQDDYSSYRGGRYQEVHNMLAIRGNSPRVCLVAHTDVCRDHGATGSRHKKAIPVVKEGFRRGESVRIIQDEDCKVQVGGDDRLGVAINTWIAINSDYDMGLLFTTDEEVGNQSADECEFPELKEFDLCVQVDRGNHSNQLVNQIGMTKLCTNAVAERLLGIAKDIELPRYKVNGAMTDVLALTRNRRIRNAVNMTCGYHNSWGSDANEYIDINEARNTFKFVSNIIKDYELESIGFVGGEGGSREPAVWEDKSATSNFESAYFGSFDNDNDIGKITMEQFEQLEAMLAWLGANNTSSEDIMDNDNGIRVEESLDTIDKAQYLLT